tara:strand:- start:27 stop:203 length:177 start_codon:yes stop_codon:yes gene_type:complete
MLPQIIIAKLISMAAKGLIPEKLIKKAVISLGDLLVKSTDNELDDKVWDKVKKLLKEL